MVYAGPHGSFWIQECEKFQLVDILVERGYVSHLDALKIQQKSHINILLNYCDEDIKGDLSAKLWEYLRWKNPIIAITKGNRDEELREIFARTRCGIVFQHDEFTHILEYLKGLLSRWKMGNYNLDLNTDSSGYQWSDNIKKLITRIDEIEK